MKFLSRYTTYKTNQRTNRSLYTPETVETGLPVQSGVAAGNGVLGELIACASNCNKDRDCMKQCRDQIAPDLNVPEEIRKQFQ